MSHHEAIHAWLRTNGPFAAGVELLKATGCDDDVLLFTLSLGETKLSREDLRQALQAAHDERVRATVAITLPAETRQLITKADIEHERQDLKRSVQLDAYDGMELSNAQDELRKKAKDALREMGYYRARLETLPSDEDRHKEALLVVKLDMVAVRAFARLDAWLATGRDPGDEPVRAELTEAEMKQELRNIESYISRVDKGRRTVSPAKLQSWKDRKDELTKKLDAVQP